MIIIQSSFLHTITRRFNWIISSILDFMEGKKWEKTGCGNTVLKAEWGGISYNPHTSASLALNGLLSSLLNAMGKDVDVKDSEETALYSKEVWRILTGDFRKDYEKVFPNLKKCLAFYESKKAEFVYWVDIKQARLNQCLEQGHLYQECYRLIYRGEKF